MPSVGDLYFEIGAKDNATDILKSSINLFETLQTAALNTAKTINEAYDIAQKSAQATVKANENFNNIIIVSAENFESASKNFKRNRKNFEIPDDQVKSVSSMADAIGNLENTIVGSLKSFSVFAATLGSIALFSDEALDVARANQILEYRIRSMADAMNYGRTSIEEGSHALNEYLNTASPSQMRTLEELGSSGYNLEYLIENMTTLKDAALIAGTSVEQMYRDFGSGGEDIRKYGITETIESAYDVTKRAWEIQQDHWIKYHRALDSSVARSQAAMEVYSSDISSFVDSNSEYFNTAEGAMTKFNLAVEKFQNSVGKIYNVGLAPFLNTLANILTFIAENPAARFVTAMGLMSSSVLIFTVTLLPKLLGGLSKLATSVALGTKGISDLLNVNKSQLILSLKQISANQALSWEIINQNILKQREIVNAAKSTVAKTADTTATEAQTAALWVNNNTIRQNNLLNMYATLVMTKRSIVTKLTNTYDLVRNTILNAQNAALTRGNLLTTAASKLMTMLGATQIAATIATSGLTAGFTAFGVAAWAALSPLLPIILPIVAAIGALILAWKAYETNFAGFKDMIDGFVSIIQTVFNYIIGVGKELYNSFIGPIQSALQPLFDAFDEVGSMLAEIGEMFGFTASEGGIFVDILNAVKFVLSAIWALVKPFFEGILIPGLKLIAQYIGTYIATGILLVANGIKNLVTLVTILGEGFNYISTTVGGALTRAFEAFMNNPAVQFIASLIENVKNFLSYIGIIPSGSSESTSETSTYTTPSNPLSSLSSANRVYNDTMSNPVFSSTASKATAIDYSRSPMSGGTNISTGGITANVTINGMSEQEATNAINNALKSSESRQLRSIQNALHTGIEKYINY